MSVLTFEEYPKVFTSIDVFIDTLNAYKGDNIWQNLIHGAEIDGAEIDEERSTGADGCVIYLRSESPIVYHEAQKIWK